VAFAAKAGELLGEALEVLIACKNALDRARDP
jgi:hypothetical protein